MLRIGLTPVSILAPEIICEGKAEIVIINYFTFPGRCLIYCKDQETADALKRGLPRIRFVQPSLSYNPPLVREDGLIVLEAFMDGVVLKAEINDHFSAESYQFVDLK